MLGDFITRILILALGYAYPGFECFKTVEKNKVQIEELRFWCQYWIIVALITVVEKFADIFGAWLPFYGEMKVAFMVYLWYPQTKGTRHVYATLLRPIISRHENDIDRQLQEWRARAWDLFIYYWQIIRQLGHSAFVQALENVAVQSIRSKATPTAKKKGRKGEDEGESESESDSEQLPSKRSSSENKQNSSSGKNKKRTSSPPSSPIHTTNHNIKEKPKSKTEYLQQEEEVEEHETASTQEEEEDHSKDQLNRVRSRLRRVDSHGLRSPRIPQRQHRD